jgi:hypothetical protein
MLAALPPLVACTDKRSDAGLKGPDKIIAITKYGPGSLEPIFVSEITIDQLDRAVLRMQNVNGNLPVKIVSAPSGTFERIALDLADFRRSDDRARSDCGGVTDNGPVTVSWHYASGKVGSYSVQTGCPRRHERRFLEAAASIARRVGLQSAISKAPKPL